MPTKNRNKYLLGIDFEERETIDLPKLVSVFWESFFRFAKSEDESKETASKYYALGIFDAFRTLGKIELLKSDEAFDYLVDSSARKSAIFEDSVGKD